jgi:hypothetical protein
MVDWRQREVTRQLWGPRTRRGVCIAALLAGCSPTLQLGGNDVTLVLSASTVVVPQGGSAPSIDVNLGGDAQAAGARIVFEGLPAGVKSVLAHDAGSGTGTITFTAVSAATPGDTTVQVTAMTETGKTSIPQQLKLTVAIAATVHASADTGKGVNGRLEEFMSTSFQPAPWQSRIPDISALEQLNPQHIHVQVYDPPWKANSSPQQDSDWDFTKLDAIVQPLLGIGDASPMLQIGRAPPLPGLVDESGTLVSNTDPDTWAANVATFAQYCAYLVQYYNTDQFSWNGKTRKSSGPPITWWAIFGDSNVYMSDTNYAQLYNAAVTAMLHVDTTLKFSAVEFADYASGTGGDPKAYFPQLLKDLNQQVDVLSTHFYSTADLTAPDARLFATIPAFASDVAYLSDAAHVPVWVTQNNVNSDVPLSNGNSQFNPTQPFANDPRGTNAFFAAWRPYLYSQLGKVGSRALYHWDYTAGHDTGPDLDRQNSEVDYTTGDKFRSYWVDYWLAHLFPATTSSGPVILQLDLSETAAPPTVEVLATRNDDGSVVVMIVDLAVRDSKEVMGPGMPRTVVVDVSALGPFASRSLRRIDANTDVVNGPPLEQPTPFDPAALDAKKMIVQLDGYGVAFLKLEP